VIVAKKKEKAVITHCTMGWDAYPCCGYSDGSVYPSKKTDMTLNKDYYKHDPSNLWAWPVDPSTGEKLGIKM